MRLFEFELAWARAAFDAVFPEGTALPHGIARDNPDRLLAEMIATSRFEQAIGLRLTIWLVALAPICLMRRPSTIAMLLPDERQRVFDRLLASRIYAVRQLAVAFKAVACLLYARSNEARRAMLGAPRVARADAAASHTAGEIPLPLESGFVAVRTRRDGPSIAPVSIAPGGTRAA
jgi:hypothetical protein